ncbi:MAG: PAS domain S-box protein, partial [Magnetococcus sp. YQC-5]
MNHMDISRESGLGAPPGRPRLHLYLLLTATLLLALLLAAGAFWGNYYRVEPEELALGYHQPAVQLLTRMVEEAQRLNDRLLDDAWSGRTLVWDKKYRTLHYDHLLVIRKRFDSLQGLEKRYVRRLAPMPEKARLLRSLEGRLLALEEEWASASVVTALIFHEFATRELPNFANELGQVRRMHEDASQLLLNRLATERAFELQVLMSSAALLLLLALWGVRRGFAHIQYTMTVLAWLEKSLQASRADTALALRASRLFPWEMDPGGTRFEQVDGGLMTVLGRPAEAWVGVEELAAVMHPEDREQALLARNAMLAGTSEESQCSYRVVKADGELVWLRDFVMVRPGEGGRGRYRGFFADVTLEQERLVQIKEQHAREYVQWNDELVGIKEQHAFECTQLAGESARLEAERASLVIECDRIRQDLAAIQEDLRNADARLWAILDHAQVAITLKDLQGCYLFVNRCFQEWFGVADADLQGCTDDTLFAASLCVESKQRERVVLEDGGVLASEEVWPMGEAMGL